MPNNTASRRNAPVGLLRFDANTLKPLRTADLLPPSYQQQQQQHQGKNINGMTFPRIQAMTGKGQRGRLPAVFLTPSSLDERPPPPALRPASIAMAGDHDYPPFSTDSITSPPNWSVLLRRNFYIGAHRFAFLSKKVFALSMGVISAWFLFGRGAGASGNALAASGNTLADSTALSDHERNAALISGVTAAVVLFGVSFGSLNHNHSHRSALMQMLWRMASSIINAVFSLTAVVFSSMSMLRLHQSSEGSAYGWNSVPTCFPLDCFSQGEKLLHMGLLLILSVVVAILSVVAVVFGCGGVRKMGREKAAIKEAAAMNRMVAYATYGATITDQYY